MKTSPHLKELFEKNEIFDQYKFTSEEDTWHIYPEKKSYELTKKLLDRENFLIIGYNNYDSYLIIDVLDNCMYKFSPEFESLTEVEFSLKDLCNK